MENAPPDGGGRLLKLQKKIEDKNKFYSHIEFISKYDHYTIVNIFNERDQLKAKYEKFRLKLKKCLKNALNMF